jgi:cobalamin biosynthesis protein CobD/CbiB
MQTSIIASNSDENLKEAAVVKMLSKEWRRNKRKSLLKGVVYTLIVVAIITVILLFVADIGFLGQ